MNDCKMEGMGLKVIWVLLIFYFGGSLFRKYFLNFFKKILFSLLVIFIFIWIIRKKFNDEGVLIFWWNFGILFFCEV